MTRIAIEPRKGTVELARNKRGPRSSKYADVDDFVLAMEIDQNGQLPFENEDAARDFVKGYKQRLSTTVRPALCKAQGVDYRYECDRDYVVGVDRDSPAVAVIMCVKNEYTKDQADKHGANLVKARAAKGNGKTKPKEKTAKAVDPTDDVDGFDL